MSAFNTLTTTYKSATQRKTTPIRLQFKYGDTWQHNYSIGETLKWGGNDIGAPKASYVAVDACREEGYSAEQTPEDFIIFIRDGTIEKIEPNTGQFDFSQNDGFVVVES